MVVFLQKTSVQFCVGQFITIYNSSSSGSNTLFCLLWIPTHVCICTLTHTEKEKLKIRY